MRRVASLWGDWFTALCFWSFNTRRYSHAMCAWPLWRLLDTANRAPTAPHREDYDEQFAQLGRYLSLAHQCDRHALGTRHQVCRHGVARLDTADAEPAGNED